MPELGLGNLPSSSKHRFSKKLKYSTSRLVKLMKSRSSFESDAASRRDKMWTLMAYKDLPPWSRPDVTKSELSAITREQGGDSILLSRLSIRDRSGFSVSRMLSRRALRRRWEPKACIGHTVVYDGPAKSVTVRYSLINNDGLLYNNATKDSKDGVVRQLILQYLVRDFKRKLEKKLCARWNVPIDEGNLSGDAMLKLLKNKLQ